MVNFSAHGGKRGLLRSAHFTAVAALGGARRYRDIDWPRVRRLVFVCKGNIFRSPFAEAEARSKGVACASFGLEADSGACAAPVAIRVAREFGVDLSSHITTTARDFKLNAGDLIVGFEPDHVDAIAVLTRSCSHCQITLLGVFSRPRTLYIHDPYGAADAYVRRCYQRIELAVDQLSRLLDHPRSTVND